MAFAAATCLLLHRHRQRQRQEVGGSASQAASGSLVTRLARALELLELQLLLALTAAVGYGRVYLGYHTPGQVAAGMALGAAAAMLWWRVTLTACRRWAAPLLRLQPLCALGMRNTLDCGDVHAREAALFSAGGGKRSD